MAAGADKIKEFISGLPAERQAAFEKLRQTIKKNLPPGFEESVSSNMLHFVVPLKTYPDGYHCQPGQPLMFISLASQKNFIALYHMGMYGSKDLLDWFTKEFPKYSKQKLDMGKSCVRFKKPDEIPLELIAALAAKMSPQQWIVLYEKAMKR